MKRRVILLAILLLLLVLLVVQSASAMASTSFRLNWFVPATGSGGAGSCTHYAMNYTVGQSFVGNSSGGYSVGLGFWAGIWQYLVHLPVIHR